MNVTDAEKLLNTTMQPSKELFKLQKKTISTYVWYSVVITTLLHMYSDHTHLKTWTSFWSQIHTCRVSSMHLASCFRQFVMWSDGGVGEVFDKHTDSRGENNTSIF